MIYETSDPSVGYIWRLFGVLVRGDHEVSDYKVRKFIHKAAHLASKEVIDKHGSAFGFSGPLGLKNIKLYIDEDVLSMKDFVVGANEDGQHLVDVNIADLVSENTEITVGDYRQTVEGDSGQGNAKLHFKTAIELGHVFKLNKRYSLPMDAKFVGEKGLPEFMTMGCYGIGVNRILAAAIEQHSDEKGIVWPKNISPYQVLVVMIDPKDETSMKIVGQLENSEELKTHGVDILVDDRQETAGVKFNDADLIGIPLRVVLGPKNLKQGKVELKVRKTGEMVTVDIPELPSQILKVLDKLA